MTAVRVTVRFFAAAAAAAGVESEVVEVAAGTTVAKLVAELGARSDELTRVLARCSYLYDGVAVRDNKLTLQNASTLDVLPPFAGG
jgi:sulfur-carrier protein